MSRIVAGMRRRNVALVTALAFALGACGGGGGMVQAPPVTPSGPPAPPPTPPPAPPPADQPPIDAQLGLINTYAAHDKGFTGAGQDMNGSVFRGRTHRRKELLMQLKIATGKAAGVCSL